MSINFDSISKGIVSTWRGQACFALLNQRFNNTDEVVYYPKFNVSDEIATRFFRETRRIGFSVGERIVSERRYRIKYGRPGIYGTKPWIGGNLTIVRYVDEFPEPTTKFVELCERYPFVDRWFLFQYAHCLDYDSDGSPFAYFNDHHSLMFFGSIQEFSTWQSVVKRIQKEWVGKPHDPWGVWGIHASFEPKKHGHGRGQLVPFNEERDRLNEILGQVAHEKTKAVHRKSGALFPPV